MQPSAEFTAARIGAMLGKLPPNARQLVLAGAGDGTLAAQYRASYPASALVVVEGDPAAAQRATGFAERVIQARLDAVGADFYRHLQWADCWLFDGTLEQLLAPDKVLAQIRAAMQYDASVVACVSNPGFALAPLHHPWHFDALQTLFGEAGFRLTHAIALRPGAAPDAPAQPASHFLLKAMPA